MKPEIQANKIVVLSGAGLSAESGLPTFRDSDGLWNQYSWLELASPEGWSKNPAAVLAFYNERREKAWNAKPNVAHIAIAELENHFEVVVLSQNVDALHERAGSSNVIHLHGELEYVRGTSSSGKRYHVGNKPVSMGDLCEDGSQLRPDIVWFGESVNNMNVAKQHVATAAKVMVVGTSLSVFPAASLVKAARGRAEKVIISPEIDKLPFGFTALRGVATQMVPLVTDRWVRKKNTIRISREET